jgi:hypothetical protein
MILPELRRLVPAYIERYTLSFPGINQKKDPMSLVTPGFLLLIP